VALVGVEGVDPTSKSLDLSRSREMDCGHQFSDSRRQQCVCQPGKPPLSFESRKAGTRPIYCSRARPRPREQQEFPLPEFLPLCGMADYDRLPETMPE
jgi:hypothetical protein